MPKYTVELHTHGSAIFSDIEAVSEEAAIEKIREDMEEGREPNEHTWEYGHLVGGCGDDAEATRVSRQRAAMIADKPKYVCTRCKDTHRASFDQGNGETKIWPCTSCPVPCEKCRAGGNGPYCTELRCKCDCHAPGRFDR